MHVLFARPCISVCVCENMYTFMQMDLSTVMFLFQYLPELTKLSLLFEIFNALVQAKSVSNNSNRQIESLKLDFDTQYIFIPIAV